MNFQDYIQPELLALVPVLYIVGAGIKKSKVPDKWIPALLGVVSVALAALWVFGTTNYSTAQEVMLAAFTAITQGMLIAGASVYVNQLIKQNQKEE